jgi:hypothetical protein
LDSNTGKQDSDIRFVHAIALAGLSKDRHFRRAAGTTEMEPATARLN